MTHVFTLTILLNIIIITIMYIIFMILYIFIIVEIPEIYVSLDGKAFKYDLGQRGL